MQGKSRHFHWVKDDRLSSVDESFERAKIQARELVAHWQGIDSTEARCLLIIAKQADAELTYNHALVSAVPKMHKLTFGSLE